MAHPLLSYSPSKSLFCPLLLVLFLSSSVQAAQQKNVTVDDTDPSIVYSGSWQQGSATNLDYGNGHQLSEDITATAKFTFTGTAVYYLSPKWPYAVDSAISIDGGSPTTVDLTDHAAPQTTGGPETVAYSVVWSRTNLQNTSHVVQVSRANNYAIVDGFIYTQSLPDNSPNSASSNGGSSTGTGGGSTATSSTGSSSAGGGANTSSGSSKTVPIAVGTVIGVLGLGVLLAIFFLWKRRQPKKNGSVAGASTWDNNAFAPQFEHTGSRSSPPMSSYYAPGTASDNYYPSERPNSASPLNAPYNYDYTSPHTADFGVAPYPAVALGVGSTSSATSSSPYGANSVSHPYSFAGAPSRTRESGTAYYNPYEEASSTPVPAVPPVPRNGASSQTSLLRGANSPNPESREVSYASDNDFAGPSGAVNQQQSIRPQYISSQEEKAALYRQQNPPTGGLSSPRPPAYGDS